MRLAVVLLLLAAPLAGSAGGPEQITLRVGERKTLGGFAPICDDPRVAVITAEGGGVLLAKGEGKTTCSVQQPGGRLVLEVTVVAEKERGNAERQ